MVINDTFTKITVETKINSPVEKVWKYWTLPEHITKWFQLSPAWHVTAAENTLEVNSKFRITIVSKDQKGHDFEGVYTHVQDCKLIEYTTNDGRNVKIAFLSQANITKIVEVFEPGKSHPLDVQRADWQAILDNFKEYTESN